MKWTRLIALLGLVALPVAACDDDDNGMTEPDPPPAPAGVQVAANGQTITVSWTAVTGADDYRVELTTAGEADREATTAGTSVDFNNLTPAKVYTAVVFASNTSGESPASDPESVETDAEEETFVEVRGVDEDATWTSDKVWVLDGPVFVGTDCGIDGNAPDCNPVTLTIEPGTTIVGKTDIPQGVRSSLLVVTRGSQIIADATGADRAPTEAETIVFTSDNPMGQRARADWGGIVINGQAPTNVGAEAEGEGDSGLYGGTDDLDDSGILRGVRIEYAGDDVTPGDQLNGLALQGVGAGTTISYVQIHYNLDDGIEPFGGTVSVDHLVVSGIGDDSVDGTDGYRGFMQFIVGQQRGDDADQGFEISNNGDDGTAGPPKSTAVLANATMIGGGDAVVDGGIAGPESDNGIQFREGSHYRVYNSIFQGFGEAGFCIRDAVTILNANNRIAGQTDPQTTMSAEGLIMWDNQAPDAADNFAACGGGSTQALNQQFYNTGGFNNMEADPGFAASAFDIGSRSSPPDFTLAAMPAGYQAADLPAPDGTNLIAPTDGRTLVQTSYAGAIEPGTDLANAWYNGWTVWSTDGSDSRPNQNGN